MLSRPDLSNTSLVPDQRDQRENNSSAGGGLIRRAKRRQKTCMMTAAATRREEQLPTLSMVYKGHHQITTIENHVFKLPEVLKNEPHITSTELH